jgi:hypothetical protein
MVVLDLIGILHSVFRVVPDLIGILHSVFRVVPDLIGILVVPGDSGWFQI